MSELIEHASVEFRILNAWFYMYAIKKFVHRKSIVRFIKLSLRDGNIAILASIT